MSSIVDTFSREDRVEVKFSDFYNLVKEATKAELLMNAIKKCVNPADTYAIMTGEDHPDREEIEASMESIVLGPIVCNLFNDEEETSCDETDSEEPDPVKEHYITPECSPCDVGEPDCPAECDCEREF